MAFIIKGYVIVQIYQVKDLSLTNKVFNTCSNKGRVCFDVCIDIQLYLSLSKAMAK